MRLLKKNTVLMILFQLIISYTTVFAETAPASVPNYPIVQNSYFTDDSGNILMFINVLGEVNHPGQIVVRENADFATLFSLTGGLKPTANLKKVLISRQNPEDNGNQVYKINLKNFYGEGDRSSFIALKPNDTIIIPENKGLNLASISRIAAVFLSGVSIYKIVSK
ncbi:MAG: hypothetical protein HGB23_05195 [Chlorobiaceae bacterium]|nr:hypothetical protein [Chlorobiaceae bacterium]